MLYFYEISGFKNWFSILGSMGSQADMLRDYSWLCTQEALLWAWSNIWNTDDLTRLAMCKASTILIILLLHPLLHLFDSTEECQCIAFFLYRECTKLTAPTTNDLGWSHLQWLSNTFLLPIATIWLALIQIFTKLFFLCVCVVSLNKTSNFDESLVPSLNFL